MTNRDELRKTFDGVADLYHITRPRYPPQLFHDLRSVASVGEGDRVLEIGCGTGQATAELAELGCRVSAVDLGGNMVRRARHELLGFPHIEVHHSSFEAWHLPDRPFDMVFCATAFHWLDPAVRLVKSARALRQGGVLAVVVTHHLAGGTMDFFVKCRRFYRRYGPAALGDLTLVDSTRIPEADHGADATGLFRYPTILRYECDIVYTAGQYVDLLSTYSDHRSLPTAARASLLSCIARLIDQEYGGTITKRYLFELSVSTRR